MSRTDGIDELDPRFPINLGPTSPEFWQALRLWEAYPSHSAQVFALEEAAHAVEQNGRPETTFVQPLPPPLEDPPPPLPVPYPPLEPDTLAHEFVPLPPLPEDGHVPGDPGCPFCHGNGDCLECDPETAWK